MSLDEIVHTQELFHVKLLITLTFGVFKAVGSELGDADSADKFSCMVLSPYSSRSEYLVRSPWDSSWCSAELPCSLPAKFPSRCSQLSWGPRRCLLSRGGFAGARTV